MNVASDPVASDPADETFSGIQIRTLLFCFILNMIDGADVLLVAYAAPLFSAEWGTPPEVLGIVFSAGLAGMTLGALFIAPLSDYVGRKAMILFSTSVIAVGMLATAYSVNIEMMIGLRFFVGLGIGSMLASVTSLSSEFSPGKFKSFGVTFAASGYPLGAVAAGFFSAAVMETSGWEGVFMYASLFSFAMFPACLLLMPESIEFLTSRQPEGALKRVNRILRQSGQAMLEKLPARDSASGKRVSVLSLMGTEHRSGTILLWLAFFSVFMTLYFLTSWIPKISVDSGLATKDAIYAGAAFNLGAFAGNLFIGYTASKVKITRLISVFFVLAAIVMVIFGFKHTPMPLFFLQITIMGCLVQGGFGALYAVAAQQYPTEIRTTGVGWALGAGRLGAIFGPYLGGITIGLGIGMLGNFIIFAIPMLTAATFITLLAWRNKKHAVGTDGPATD